MGLNGFCQLLLIYTSSPLLCFFLPLLLSVHQVDFSCFHIACIMQRMVGVFLFYTRANKIPEFWYQHFGLVLSLESHLIAL